MALCGYREGFLKKKQKKKNMAGDRRARTEQTQYRKGREAEGTKIKTKNREERREKKKQRTGGNE